MIPLTFACQSSASLFAGTAVISSLVLVAIILIEVKIINVPPDKKPFRSLKYLTVINLLAAISGITFMFILNHEMQHEIHLNGIILILCWLALPLILIGIEYLIYQGECKNIRKRKLLGSLASINITSYIIFSLLTLFIYSKLDGTRTKAPRISCFSNLKQIGLALRQYSMDNKDFFPDKGLEQLRSNDYLTDILAYNCPSTKTPKLKTNKKLTEKNVDYIYQKGLKYKANGNTPLVWDKPTNHEGYGNVLFSGCHVKGFGGLGNIDWMEQAGIKKTATQQGK